MNRALPSAITLLRSLCLYDSLWFFGKWKWTIDNNQLEYVSISTSFSLFFWGTVIWETDIKVFNRPPSCASSFSGMLKYIHCMRFPPQSLLNTRQSSDLPHTVPPSWKIMHYDSVKQLLTCSALFKILLNISLLNSSYKTIISKFLCN